VKPSWTIKIHFKKCGYQWERHKKWVNDGEYDGCIFYLFIDENRRMKLVEISQE
jgi:hypothetical protein